MMAKGIQDDDAPVQNGLPGGEHSQPARTPSLLAGCGAGCPISFPFLSIIWHEEVMLSMSEMLPCSFINSR